MAKRRKHDPEEVFRAFRYVDEEEVAGRLSDHEFTEYGFYQPIGRRERLWRFTCCGEETLSTKGRCPDIYCDDIHAYKHNDKMNCPFCGRNVIAKCVTRLRTNREGCYESLKESRNVCVLNPYDNGVLVDCGVLWRHWQPGELGNGGYGEALMPWPGEIFDYWDKRRYFIAPGEVLAWRYETVWHHGLGDKWYHKYAWNRKKAVCRRPFQPWSLYHFDREDGMYSTVNPGAILETELRYCGIDHYVGDLWDGMFNYATVAYLVEWAYHPQLEMLTKLGHNDVIFELLEHRNRNRALLNWNAKRPNDFFRMSRAEYRLFRANGGGLADLEILHGLDCVDTRTYFEIKKTVGLSGDSIKYCAEISTRLGISLQRAANYVAKGNQPGLWRDYLDAAEKLGLDLRREDVAMPRDLRRRHDDAVALARYQQNDLARKSYQRKILPRLKQKYEFSLDGLSVLVPENDVQIITEGKVLQHCVGGYAQRHLEGRTVILFLRRAEALEESYVTIEMNGNVIVQAHGFRNDMDATPPLERHEAFFDAWLQWLERGSQRYSNGMPKIEREVKTA